jgi:class 3 adenylate cyclase
VTSQQPQGIAVEWSNIALAMPASSVALPTGIVTFLFTDIEGSTRMLQEQGEDYGDVQKAHFAIMRDAISLGRGYEVSTEGDAFDRIHAEEVGNG